MGVCSPGEGVLEGDSNDCHNTLNVLKATLLGAQSSGCVAQHLWCHVSLPGSLWQPGYQRRSFRSCLEEETGFGSLVQETGIVKLTSNQMVLKKRLSRGKTVINKAAPCLRREGLLPVLTLSSCSPAPRTPLPQETQLLTLSWKPPISGHSRTINGGFNKSWYPQTRSNKKLPEKAGRCPP